MIKVQTITNSANAHGGWVYMTRLCAMLHKIHSFEYDEIELVSPVFFDYIMKYKRKIILFFTEIKTQ
jgi:effector-binding domain-containing protein